MQHGFARSGSMYLAGVLRLRQFSGRSFRFLAGGHRKVNGESTARAKIITAQAIPTAQPLYRYAKIFGDGTKRVTLAHPVTRSTPRIADAVVRVASSNGDDQFASGFEIVALQMISSSDRLGCGAVAACHSGKRVLRKDFA